MDWHFAHLNTAETDYNGVDGTIYDYTLTVYALDCELGLSEGYFLNEFRRAVRGHVLDEASLELPSRA